MATPVSRKAKKNSSSVEAPKSPMRSSQPTRAPVAQLGEHRAAREDQRDEQRRRSPCEPRAGRSPASWSCAPARRSSPDEVARPDEQVAELSRRAAAISRLRRRARLGQREARQLGLAVGGAVEHHDHAGGDDQRPAGDRPGRRPLAQEDEGVERGAHRLDVGDDRRCCTRMKCMPSMNRLKLRAVLTRPRRRRWRGCAPCSSRPRVDCEQAEAAAARRRRARSARRRSAWRARRGRAGSCRRSGRPCT